MSRTGLAVRILLLATGMMVAAILSAWVAFTFLTRGGEATVPALEGLELRAALELTSREQLGLRIAGTGYDAGIPPGHVISQDPVAGARIKENRIIRVTVSQGTPSVFVPNLGSLTLRKAELQLAQAGLTLGKTGHTYDQEVSPGLVITQQPSPGRFVPRSSGINLLISRGGRPEIYIMPDMVGLPMEMALEWIRGRDLKSGRIREEEDDRLPPGTVKEVNPPYGSAVTEGQSVHLTVSRVPEASDPVTLYLYHYRSPVGLLERTLRLVLETNAGQSTVWEGVVEPGTSVSIPVPVTEPGTLRAYLDDVWLEEKKVP